jgi:hypothetical protein
VTANQALENRVLRRIFELRRKKVAVGYRKLQNEELNDLCFSSNIVNCTGVAHGGRIIPPCSAVSLSLFLSGLLAPPLLVSGRIWKGREILYNC